MAESHLAVELARQTSQQVTCNLGVMNLRTLPVLRFLTLSLQYQRGQTANMPDKVSRQAPQQVSMTPHSSQGMGWSAWLFLLTFGPPGPV